MRVDAGVFSEQVKNDWIKVLEDACKAPAEPTTNPTLDGSPQTAVLSTNAATPEAHNETATAPTNADAGHPTTAEAEPVPSEPESKEASDKMEESAHPPLSENANACPENHL